MYRLLLLAVCLALLAACSVVFAGTPPPNLGGTWKIDQDRSTAAPDLTTAIVITQMGDVVRFDYFEGKRLAAREDIIADGRSRQRYKTRQAKSFATARWQKDALVVETVTALDNEGLQSYSGTERWAVSKDGKTLTLKTSDGKLKVFTRIAGTEEPGRE